MKIGVVGSRNFKRPDLVRALVNKFKDEDILISGGCRGKSGQCPDSIAEQIADKRGLKKEIYQPEFGCAYNASAYHERNAKIVRESDVMVIFWDRRSPGTKSALRKIIEESDKLG